MIANKSMAQQLEEIFNVKPKKKDSDKLEAQRKKFVGTCRVCGQPLTYMGGNILVCTNDKCKGRKITYKDKETGEEKFDYKPVFRLLDTKGEEIGRRLFSE